ncbi:MAG: ATPase [Bacteroidetes bacterium GWA2_30_7]|nr:MAG: ATPase [Bacteroidetes bacterium GWA2_30_7]
MIQRNIETQINEHLFKGKAIILLGPRQTGKTTLIKKILNNVGSQTLYFNGDDPIVTQILNRPNTQQLKQIIGKNTIVFIDEAQRINEIGITAKIIIDEFPDVQLILSGSSAFELSQKTNEPLTGRKWTYHLSPISWEEWQNNVGYLKAEQDLENRLVFGFYPDVLINETEPVRILKELTESYLYKDVLMYGNLKKPEEIQKLLQAIAYQVGSEVSMRELGEIVGSDPKTIERYITVLERAFVIFRLFPFSLNLRNEIKTNRKIYFYDNGIRNAVINQLQPLAARQDIGILWENFLISERNKLLNYNSINANRYFWRTVQQQEIDYVEEIDGKLFAYEFKWNEKRKVKFSKTFTETYSSQNIIVNRGNFRDFVIHQ